MTRPQGRKAHQGEASMPARDDQLAQGGELVEASLWRARWCMRWLPQPIPRLPLECPSQSPPEARPGVVSGTPFPSQDPIGRGAQRRGWENRSHPDPRADGKAGEHGEDGEDRTFPAASTLAPLRMTCGRLGRSACGYVEA